MNICRPLPSLGIGEAVPGITAGVLHLQTFSIPAPPAKFKASAAALSTIAMARSNSPSNPPLQLYKAATQADGRNQNKPLTVSIRVRNCHVARFRRPFNASNPPLHAPLPRLQGCNPGQRTLAKQAPHCFYRSLKLPCGTFQGPLNASNPPLQL